MRDPWSDFGEELLLISYVLDGSEAFDCIAPYQVTR